MDNILKAIIEINNCNEAQSDMTESTASFPSEDLPLDIWDKADDSYVIKPELKEKILGALSEYPNLDLINIANSIKIVGSIGTNLYDEDADIDIHIEPKEEALEGKSPEELEQIQRDVMSWFKQERDAKDWYVNKHPFEVFFSLNPISDYYSDTVYDLLQDKWLKPVKMYSMDYNPFTQYGDFFSEMDEVLAASDVLLGKLHREVKDIKKLQANNQEAMAKEKLEAIKKTITELYATEEKWYEIRKRNSAQDLDELPEDPSTLELSDEWRRDNTLFKFIAGYGYKSVISKLSDLVDEETNTLDPDALDKIPAILSEFYNS